MSETPLDSAAEIPSSPYALETVTHLNADQLERLTGVFRDIGVDGWLEQHPLSRLELVETVLDEGRPVNGIYFFKTGQMQITTRRPKDTYRQPFEWERTYSVSSTAQTQAEAIQKTLVHELGHHVHNTLRLQDLAYFLETQRSVVLRGGTMYAKDNPLEYFAESFALYTFYPTELLVRDPDGYGMIEKTLGYVGLEVKHR